MVRSRKSNPGRAARHGRTEQGISVMAEDIETVRPKKRKKKNALKHGVYSREVMLPGEHTRDYDALAAELTEEWAPEGLTERSLVDRLVGLYWRKQRLDRYEHAKLQQRVQQIREDNVSSREIQKLKAWGPKFQDAASGEEVDEILCKLNDVYDDYIEEKVPYDEAPDAPPRGPAIARVLADLPPLDRLEGPAKFIALVNPDLIESDLARSDRIDETIDRTIKRLMQVKTAKQIFPNMRRNASAAPKLIQVPALTDESEQSSKLPDKVEIPAKPMVNLRMVSDGPFLRIG
jgi:hypothetical protein